MRINFTNTDTGGSFTPVPAGTYNGVVTKIGSRESQSGKEGIEFTIKLENGRQVYDTFWLSEAALWRFKKFLISAGVPADEVEGDYDFDPQEFIGTDVVVTIEDPDERWPNRTNVKDTTASGVGV